MPSEGAVDLRLVDAVVPPVHLIPDSGGQSTENVARLLAGFCSEYEDSVCVSDGGASGGGGGSGGGDDGGGDVDEDINSLIAFCEVEITAIRMLGDALGGTSVAQIQYLSTYGAAVIYARDAVVDNRSRVRVVGPDEWRFDVRTKRSGDADDKRHHTAVAGRTNVALDCGTIAESEVETFCASLRGALETLRHRRQGDKRHAGINGQGHQHTPAFVGAVTGDVIRYFKEGCNGGVIKYCTTSPRGGTTDVGQHTGGRLRDTCWPIVRAAAEDVLARTLRHAQGGWNDGDGDGLCGDAWTGDPKHGLLCSDVFDKLMTYFHLWLLESTIAIISPSEGAALPPVTDIDLNRCMLLLQSTVKQASALSDRGFTIPDEFEQRCKEARRRIDHAATTAATAVADRYLLDSATLERESTLSCRMPRVVLPAPLVASNDLNALDTARKNARDNIDWLPLLVNNDGINTCTFVWAKAWTRAMRDYTQSGEDGKLLLISTVERLMWSFAEQYLLPMAAPVVLTISTEEIAALHDVVDEYRTVTHSFISHNNSSNDNDNNNSVPIADLRSREMLVVWVMACLTHASAVQMFPIAAEFDFALHAEDLRHLVLSDKRAQDAAAAVAGYIGCTCHWRTREIFSTRLGGLAATIDMAQRIGSSDPALQQRCNRENAAAAERVADHWKKVLEHKHKLEEAREKVEELEGKLRRCQTNYDTASRCDRSKYQRRLYQAEGELAEWTSTRDRWIKAPPPVIQPLPANAKLAAGVIFFLEMPLTMQLLARATFTAQQMLVRGHEAEIRVDPGVRWSTHHRDCNTVYGGYSPITGGVTDAPVILVTPSNQFATKCPPDIVDSCYSERDGVWYPDAVPMLMAWSGGSFALDQMGYHFDLFSCSGVSSLWAEQYYTESFARTFRSLNWALSTPADADNIAAQTRGNEPLARLDERPHWLDQEEFLTFGRLRAYGHTQTRNVCMALRDRSLPLDNTTVHTLIRQAVFQIGPLASNLPSDPTQLGKADGARPDDATSAHLALEWRVDWWHGDGLAALDDALRIRGDRAQSKQRDHATLLLVGELASYFASFENTPELPRSSQQVRKQPQKQSQQQNLRQQQRWRRQQQQQQQQRQQCETAATIIMKETATATALRRLHEKATEFGATARSVASHVLKWASGVDKDLETARADNPSLAPELAARKCLYYAYALLCYGTGLRLQSSDLEVMMDTLLLFDYTFVQADGSSLMPDLRQLRTRVRRMMATRLWGETEALLDSSHLTHAVNSVIPSSCLGSDTTWYSMDECIITACYEAEEKGHLYTVNVYTGRLLVDGKPLGRLPTAVTQHPLYRRVFDQREFEVVELSGCVWRTVRPANERDYEFSTFAGNVLVVREIDGQLDEVLELLDNSDVDAIFPDLPTRLRQLHSHWLSRERGVVLFRRIQFFDRRVNFVAGVSGGGSACAGLAVIPKSLVLHTPWSDLLHATQWTALDKLVILHRGSDDDDEGPISNCAGAGHQTQSASEVLAVLSKFERPEYIHVLKEAVSGNLVYDLPRFGLQFELTPPVLLPSNGSVLLKAENPVTTEKRLYHLRSRQYLGYNVCANPQMPDHLRGFSRYLPLECDRCSAWTASAHHFDCDAFEKCMLVPNGIVVRSGDNTNGGGTATDVVLSEDADAHLQANLYGVHPRLGSLRAKSLLARLQLSALHAATGTLVPEPNSITGLATRGGVTGGEAAINVLRQCWQNRPLSDDEQHMLACVLSHSGHEPALSLLCAELKRSASRLQNLFEATEGKPGQRGDETSGVDRKGGKDDADNLNDYDHDVGDCDASDAYQCIGGDAHVNHRRLLSPEEVRLALGSETAVSSMSRTLYRDRPGLVDPGTCPVDCSNDGSSGSGSEISNSADLKSFKVVREWEELLMLFDPVIDSPSTQAAPFPLSLDGSISGEVLPGEMARELQESWAAFQAIAYDVSGAGFTPPPKLLLLRTRSLVTEKLHKVEHYLFEKCLSTIPDPALRLRRLANLAATPNRSDCVRMACDSHADSTRSAFNPHLSRGGVAAFRRALSLFLQLCVLEDKLHRLVALTDAAIEDRAEVPPVAEGRRSDRTIHLIRRDLRAVRIWDPWQHPKWLAFEAESRLQIRPEQYRIAQILMENPSHLCQLNMGLGKTRVIAPILMLHFASGRAASEGGGANRRWLVRLHVLRPLLTEAVAYFRGRMTAGVLGVRIWELPYMRGCLSDNGVRRVQAMRETLELCRHTGGCLVVAPSYRLSLSLQLQELMSSNSSTEDVDISLLQHELRNLIVTPRCVDIFDESDALLHHKYQLVYAIGTPTPLPSGAIRWGAVEVIMRVLNDRKDGDAISTALEMPGLAVIDDVGDDLGRFIPFRLLGAGNNCDDILDGRKRLWRAVAEKLLDDPPYELQWMSEWCEVGYNARDTILTIVLDETVDATAVLTSIEREGGVALKRTEQTEWLLALRGMLASRVLEHCLSRRHRVDYGCHPKRRVPTRMAVPFKAADTPSDTAEYAHADAVHCYARLAHYCDGLTQDTMREAVRALLSFNLNGQRHYYEKRWLPGANRKGLTAAEYASIDQVEKLDTTNEAQALVLFRTFRYSMEAIKLWLAHCVFPSETHMYPRRLSHSAWHLPGERSVGFSGTCDNDRLLPLTLTQHAYKEDDRNVRELLATDGKMLAAVLRHTRGGVMQRLPTESETIAWMERGGGATKEPRKSAPLWQRLLHFSLRQKAHALIDTGGLLAGVGLREAAHFVANWLTRHGGRGTTSVDSASVDDDWQLVRESEGLSSASVSFPRGGGCDSGGSDSRPSLSRADGPLRGVVFYDMRLHEWRFTDGSTDVALGVSAVRERDAFVIFDESRCRGADMKLRNNAVAVLTLGPGIGKDKLMQGAGRMRQLGHGQRLVFVGLNEVHDTIRRMQPIEGSGAVSPSVMDTESSCLPKIDSVMQLVMHHTYAANVGGLSEWAAHGSHHSISNADPSRAAIDEHASLEEMYAAAMTSQPVADVVSARCKMAGKTAKDAPKKTIDLICERAAKYGSTYEVFATRADEECERELQVEQEEEEEQEREFGKQKPRAEAHWPYDVAVCGTLMEVSKVVKITPATEVVARAVPAASTTGWSQRVYCTENYVRSLKTVAALDCLRVADVVLVFQTSDMLLLSEREAAGVLRAMSRDEAPTNVFVHRTYLCRHDCIFDALLSLGAALPPALLDTVSTGPNAPPTRRQEEPSATFADVAAVTLQLFGGESSFGGGPRRLNAARVVLPTQGDQLTAKELLAHRGRQKMIPLSDVEKVCSSITPVHVHGRLD